MFASEYSRLCPNFIVRSLCTILILAAAIGLNRSMSDSMTQTRENRGAVGLGLTAQADSLKKYGALVLSTYGNDKDKYESVFFNYFPSTFGRFDSLYGYRQVSIDSFIFMPLYGSNHICKVFAHMKSIDDTTYYRKLLGISVGAHWEADQVSLFQHTLINKVKRNLGLTCSILRGMSDTQVRSFWLFFFDMRNPSAVDFSFLDSVKDARIVRLMKEAMEIDRVKWSTE